MDIRFTFLRIAIGSDVDTKSFALTGKDWSQLFDFCRRQALLGVGFTAVEKLHKAGIECPQDLRRKWMSIMFGIEVQNKNIICQCKEFTKQLEHDGLRCCILKGQGNLLNYPEYLRLRRNPGDIDIWCAAPVEGLAIAAQIENGDVEYNTYHGRRAIIEYVQMQNRNTTGREKRALFHHIEAPDFNGTEVEVHYRPSFCHSPLRNIRMQRWFKEQSDVCMKNKTHVGFSVPTTSVNVVYQMCHLFSHIFETGLGLRQLLDYYFVLKSWYNDVMEYRDLQVQGMSVDGLGVPVMSKEEVMRVLSSFGMRKFAAAVMWVLKEVFAMPAPYYICEPNEKEGRKLLEEIMQGGNFGQYDTRGASLKNGGMISHGVWKLKRVMRLVGSYPEEALWEPMFRVYHLMWRSVH